MPIYPMKCTFQSCGTEFDLNTKAALYERSKGDGFRDIRCTRCGSFGTVDRFWPRDSAPANLTVKGTWGRHASPGLKGKDFYTKQERDRQLASVGRGRGDIDYSGNPIESRQKKVFKRNEDSGEVEEVKVGTKKERPTVWRVGDETPAPPKAPENIAKEVAELRSERAQKKTLDAEERERMLAKKDNASCIALYLKDNGPSRLKDIAKATGIAPSAINKIASADKNGISRVGRGVYSVTSP